MLQKVAWRVGLFASLVGYGVLMQPPQMQLTDDEFYILAWIVVFALIAVASVSLLVSEVRSSR